MKTRLVSFFFIIGLLPMKAQITEQYYDINNTCWRFTELTDYGCSAARITEIAGNVPGDIVIPSSVSAGEDSYLVTEVGEHVFSGKKNIASINIPNTIQVIGYNAFYECSNLYSVMIPSIEDWCKIYFNGYYSNPLRYATRLLVGGKVYTSLEIPETVTTLNSYVFAGFKELKSIVLPDNLIAIGQYAFENCSNLTTAVLPTQLTSIGPSAFHGCKAMTSLELPDGLASIGDNSFTGCSGLTNIVIPSSVSSIGKFAFYGCDNLQTVTVKNSLPLTLTEGTFSDITNTTLYVPSGSKAAYEAADYWKEFKEIIESSPIITFADPNVKNLCVANWDTDGDGEMSEDEAAAVSDLGEVFKGNTSITSFDELVYFNGLTSIGKHTFYGCTGLSSIIIPEEVTNIGLTAFMYCSELKSLTIPSNTSTIGKNAFGNCTGLSEIVIPKSVTSMPNSCFMGCSGLQSIIVESGNTVYDSRNGCNAIIKTESGELITGCKSTVIPKDVTAIAQCAFMNIKSLTTITIPSSVTAINPFAFSGCDNLTSVIMENVTPVNINLAFTNQTNITVYVPFGSKDAYEANEQWKEFKEIVELGTVEPTDISTLTDAIYINALNARVGATTTMEINLKNSEKATAYVFDLVLPEGITVAKNESGKYIDVLSDRHDDHSRTFNYKGDNTYSLATLSGNSELLTDHDGTIRILTLEVADDMAEGSYVIEIKNASYSTPTGYDVMLPETKALITVEDYILGDVNGNDRIDIGDAVSIVNYLVGKESTKFVEKAADTNKNGRIDIGDAVTIVNFLVGKTESLSRTIGVEQNEREPQ